MRLCAPFSGVFCVVLSQNLLIYFPKRTVRSFAENSERKARDSKDEEADPSRERQTGIRGLFCALVLSLSQNRVVL